MTTTYEQGKNNLTERAGRSVKSLRNVGYAIVKKLNNTQQEHPPIPIDISQLPTAEIPKYKEPKHSQDSGNAFLSVKGIQQEPGRPLTKEELTHQPLLTHNQHMSTRHRPSWVKTR